MPDSIAIANSMISDLIGYLANELPRIKRGYSDDDTDYLPAASGLLNILISAHCLTTIGDDPLALDTLISNLSKEDSDEGDYFLTISANLAFTDPSIQKLADDWANNEI